MNLQEALHFTPGLQIATPELIPHLLEDPRLRGKEDSTLTRLAHYKLLEQRHADQAALPKTVGSNFDFLRASNIRVIFDFDIEGNIDRAIEIINRTNQLNFTKLRLPEDPEEARAELRGSFDYSTRAGLLRVVDKYGDYGYCGFYQLHGLGERTSFKHLALSCRLLNMGIEQWLYRYLKRPMIKVNGDVLRYLR